MTEIVFHHGVALRLRYCARLLRKAYQKDIGLIVLAPRDTLQALSNELHLLRDTEFIPHYLEGQPTIVQLASPIWLLSALPSAPSPFERLINLSPQIPLGFESFGQLIEIIDTETQTRAQGRLRLEHYKQRGYPISLIKAT